MAKFDFDFFVVGAGSGGVRAARIASSLGARVGIAEVAQLGGTCVNVGCVPKKLLVYASEFGQGFRDAQGFGWSPAAPDHDFAALIQAKDQEIGRLNQVYERLLSESGVHLLRGHATLRDPHTLQVGAETFTAEYILLAPGGRPFIPPMPGQELAITSNDVFAMRQLPRRIIVVGGGYIAVEFAGIFRGLGAEVSLVHRAPTVLRGFDQDVCDALGEALVSSGVRAVPDAEPAALTRQGQDVVMHLQDGATLAADAVLMATGRVPNVERLGLEHAGVKTRERGAIHVDAYSQTSVPHIYAVGDVTDRLALTPVAIAEGQAVAETLFGPAPCKPEHLGVPTAVFSQPQVGTVGWSEQEARRDYEEVRIFRSRFRPMKHTLSGSEQRTMMKLVVDAKTDRVLGCHMVGPDAAEIIQGFAVALRCGATKRDFDRTIGIHPTAAEEFVTMRTPV